MSSKKDDSQGLIGLILSAWLMASLGVLLGVAYMLSFEPRPISNETDRLEFVAKISEPGARPNPKNVFYMDGASIRSNEWPLKQRQLEAAGPQTVRITAGEINSWLRSNFRAGEKPEGNEAGSLMIVPGMLSVAMAGSDILYLSIPVEVIAFGSRNDWILFARVAVSEGRFSLEEVRLSSAKIPLPNLMGKRIVDSLLAGFQSGEAYGLIENALERTETIEVDGGELVMQLL
jgi:hypothetical protein